MTTQLENTQQDIVVQNGNRHQDQGADSAPNLDYDLSQPINLNGTGLRQGLASYGDPHFSLFLRKVFIKALGYSEDALSRPIIGIVNTYSSFNPCHANIPQLMEAVKRGIQFSGGLAVDFPTISLHEAFSSPTSMYLRNLMSMDTEEMIRAQPCDAVVLIGGWFIMIYIKYVDANVGQAATRPHQRS
jgi:dihydroxy-acid dehydratase